MKRSLNFTARAKASKKSYGRRRRPLLVESLEQRMVLTFAGPVAYSVGTGPQAVAIGDFNGDSVADVISANSGSSDVSVLPGNGDGTLGPAASFAADAGAHSVAVGDFDQDPAGGLDAVTANSFSMSLLLGDGDGTIQPPVNGYFGDSPRSVAVGDLDGDGDLDIVETTTVSTLGPFKEHFNDDYVVVFVNDLDPATHFASFVGTAYHLSFYEGSAAGPDSVQIADINGHPSVVFTNPRLDTVSVMLGSGTGGLASPVSFSTGNSPRSVTVADINGDSIADLAVANSGSNSVSILLGTGTSDLFQSAGNVPTAAAPISITSGDVNGDGHADLATANGTGLSLHFGYGDGSFGAAQPIAAGPGPSSVSATDLNADGRPDLVVTNPSANQVSVVLNNNDWVTPLVRPSATISGPAVGLINQSLDFTLGASEAGLPADTVYSFAIDWNGDGASDETVSGASGSVISHTFPAGVYAVGVTAADSSGNTSPLATLSINVLPVSISVQTDPANASRLALVVDGSAGGDTIVLSPGAGNGVAVNINGTAVGEFTAPGDVALAHVIVDAAGGDDVILLSGGLNIPSLLSGGDGDDSLSAAGSTAPAILVGGTGNDTLTGGSDRDLLIGGLGSDSLTADGDDDILIGCATDYDLNSAALLAIMAEWDQAGVSYGTRISHLMGTGKGKNAGGGLNGSYFLNSTTVHDDGATDTLTAGSGTDWFIARTKGASAKDVLTDKVRGETVTQV